MNWPVELGFRSGQCGESLTDSSSAVGFDRLQPFVLDESDVNCELVFSFKEMSSDWLLQLIYYYWEI